MHTLLQSFFLSDILNFVDLYLFGYMACMQNFPNQGSNLCPCFGSMQS